MLGLGYISFKEILYDDIILEINGKRDSQNESRTQKLEKSREFDKFLSSQLEHVKEFVEHYKKQEEQPLDKIAKLSFSCNALRHKLGDNQEQDYLITIEKGKKVIDIRASEVLGGIAKIVSHFQNLSQEGENVWLSEAMLTIFKVLSSGQNEPENPDPQPSTIKEQKALTEIIQNALTELTETLPEVYSDMVKAGQEKLLSPELQALLERLATTHDIDGKEIPSLSTAELLFEIASWADGHKNFLEAQREFDCNKEINEKSRDTEHAANYAEQKKLDQLNDFIRGESNKLSDAVKDGSDLGESRFEIISPNKQIGEKQDWVSRSSSSSESSKSRSSSESEEPLVNKKQLLKQDWVSKSSSSSESVYEELLFGEKSEGSQPSSLSWLGRHSRSNSQGDISLV